MVKIRNETSSEYCGWCIDGWVELKGTVKAFGVTYSRGSAPCRWCETGQRRWSRMKELRHPVDDSYSEQDVERPARWEPAARPGDARRLVASLAGSLPRPPAGESRAEIEAKRALAQKALEQDEGTVELPAEPAPAQPDDYSDIPF